MFRIGTLVFIGALFFTNTYTQHRVDDLLGTSHAHKCKFVSETNESRSSISNSSSGGSRSSSNCEGITTCNCSSCSGRRSSGLSSFRRMSISDDGGGSSSRTHGTSRY